MEWNVDTSPLVNEASRCGSVPTWEMGVTVPTRSVPKAWQLAHWLSKIDQPCCNREVSTGYGYFGGGCSRTKAVTRLKLGTTTESGVAPIAIAAAKFRSTILSLLPSQ